MYLVGCEMERQGATPREVINAGRQETIDDLRGTTHFTDEQIARSIDTYMENVIKENQDQRHRMRLMSWEVAELFRCNIERRENMLDFMNNTQGTGVSTCDLRKMQYYETQSRYLKGLLSPEEFANVATQMGLTDEQRADLDKSFEQAAADAHEAARKNEESSIDFDQLAKGD
jgi:hypothetical protein